MKFWKAAPIIRILLPFIAGILSVEPLLFCKIEPIVVAVSLAIVLVLIASIPVFKNYKNSIYYGFTLFLFIYSIGYCFAFERTMQCRLGNFRLNLKNSALIYVRIEDVVEKDKSVKAVAEILSLKEQTKVPVSVKILLYFQKNEQALKLNYGDELILKNKLMEVPVAKNPGEFDYKRFLADKNIHFQAFLKSNQWINTHLNNGNVFKVRAIAMRNRLLAILKQAQLKNDEFAVASALMVGYTDKLDESLLSAYSQTGAMHVLSVSGLHVGIVFMVLNALLFFLDRFRYGLILKATLLICSLWAYAFITGLSPSVIRAAAMFSFMVCGKVLEKKSILYNTLAASALLMLIYDPFYVYDVGFQLSYFAVIGIVTIQPFFSSFIKTDNWMLCQATSLITVSIAAQLATFPLSIYYFHQFPNYFLLTNLIAVPLSAIIIYLGIVLLIFCGIPFFANYLSYIFGLFVHILNNSIRWISQLPYANTDGIFINKVQLITLYLSIIFLMVYLFIKRVRSLYCFLGSLIFLLFIQLTGKMKAESQRKIIVYAFSQTSAIDFVEGKQHALYSNLARAGSDLRTMAFKQYWQSLKLGAPILLGKHVRTATVYIDNEFIQFYTKRIVILSDPQKTKQLLKTRNSLKVDYLVLTHNVDLPLIHIIQAYHPYCLVFDGSNTPHQVKRWKKECNDMGQDYYSVMDEGALEIEM